MRKDVAELKIEYREYLNGLNIDSLRSLGRHVGVFNPTENKKKGDLIELIIAVLVGETKPVDRTRRGAPVKAVLNPEILSKLKEISGGAISENSSWALTEKEKKEIVDYNRAMDEALGRYMRGETKNRLFVSSPKCADLFSTPKIYVGQVEKVSDYYCLFPANARDFNGKILIPEEIFHAYDLKEGDLISCTVGVIEETPCVMKIFNVNEFAYSKTDRNAFENLEIDFSGEKLELKNNPFINSFLPIAKGRRGVIVAPPKAGKTTLLKNISKDLIAQSDVKTFGLLIDQPPETAMEFKSIFETRDLIYTTYEDEPDAHVFSAEFILKRAKRYAESGRDVVLLIDGIQGLAKSYDELNYESEKSLACGLTAKTVRYIKKYLSAARSFKTGGSLTIICTLSIDTGNREDDLFYSEISPAFNTKISLNGEFAFKRFFPSIDLTKSVSDDFDKFSNAKMIETYLFIQNDYLPQKGAEKACRLISEFIDFDDFLKKAKAELNN